MDKPKRKRGRPRKEDSIKFKKAKMGGLIYPDGHSESDDQIKSRLYSDGTLPPPVKETPLPKDRDFSYWSGRLRSRREQYLETQERQQHVSIQFHDDTLINVIPDIHAGSGNTFYHRVEQEIETIVRTPNSYAILLGDIIDGFFFNPAQMEEIEQVPEQIEYYNALLRYLAENNKLIAGWGGDHDNWSKKMGAGANARFSRDTGAYYMNGVGFITAKVCDQEYNLVGTHRPRGYSMYNNAHGAMRMAREIEGVDVVFTAHTHSKAIHQQPVHEFGGVSRIVTAGSCGAYKSTDDYSQKLGFADNASESMFGWSFILHKGGKVVSPHYDIVRANIEFKKMMESR